MRLVSASFFIFSTLILSSCAQLGKKKEAQGSAPQVVDQSAERIVGSSKIGQPHKYKGKTYFLYGAEHLKLENYYFDIPVVYNASVKKWISYFLNKGRGFFERYSARAGRYAPLMAKILNEHGLPRDLIFLAMAESGFRPTAKSWARAVGAWQFMPYTGRRFGLEIDWFIDERRDPKKASFAAANYLEFLFKEFGSWELAAAAYNAGEGKMSRAIRRYKTENFWRIRRGRYLKSETKNYVPKIMALAIIGKNLKSFGFEEIIFDGQMTHKTVDVPPFTDLISLAERLDIDFEEIELYNPEVLRWLTPGDRNYSLKLSPTVYNTFQKTFPDKTALKDLKAKSFASYKVKGRSARLKHVARKFRLKKDGAKFLAKLNNMRLGSRLKRGQKVILPFREGQNGKGPMYADLYHRPRKSVVRRRRYGRRIAMAKRRGRRITSPKGHYTVKRGDSLWSIARKNEISVDTLIKSNLHIVGRRYIRAGDRLIVR